MNMSKFFNKFGYAADSLKLTQATRSTTTQNQIEVSAMV
jgi:hypothetical protein